MHIFDNMTTKHNNTIYDNIRELNSRQKLIDEEKLVFCKMLASSIAKDNSEAEALQTALFDCAEAITSFDTNELDIVDLFRTTINESSLSVSEFFKDALLYDELSAMSSVKIVYVKNNYTDAAFFKFSTVFKTPKVSYRTSFEEICEDVYNGVGDYCILPIENAGGGKLFTFYALIDKYDLKISAVCDLYEGTSEHSTRYALLSRKVTSYDKKETSSYIEFSIISDNGNELSNILSAAKKCGIGLFRIDTISVPYDDSRFRYYLIFESEGKQAIPFLMFLNFKYPQYKNIGYYISL